MIDKKFEIILLDIMDEFKSATKRWGGFSSLHEAYAIVLEEVNELWDEVKAAQKNPSRIKFAREEAIQVATMSIRLIYDCCDMEGD